MNARIIPSYIEANVRDAYLPLNYETAKAALARCESVDECKDWSNKAAAVASYAKQSRDDTMLNSARRIQLRAKRRIGELLLELSSDGVRNNRSPRGKAARRAGLSEGEKQNAMALARAPRPQFDAMVDSSPPARQADLVALGRVRHNGVHGTSALERGFAYRTCMGSIAGNTTSIGPFVRWIDKHDARELASGISSDEASLLRPMVRRAIDWLDIFDEAMPK